MVQVERRKKSLHDDDNYEINSHNNDNNDINFACHDTDLNMK